MEEKKNDFEGKSVNNVIAGALLVRFKGSKEIYQIATDLSDIQYLLESLSLINEGRINVLENPIEGLSLATEDEEV